MKTAVLPLILSTTVPLGFRWRSIVSSLVNYKPGSRAMLCLEMKNRQSIVNFFISSGLVKTLLKQAVCVVVSLLQKWIFFNQK